MHRPVARRSKSLSTATLLVVAAVLALLVASPASAQRDVYSFTASLSGTIGGTLDSNDPDPGLGNTGFQLNFTWDTQPKTRVGVRYGQVDFSGERIEQLIDPELTYLSIAGEYTYQEAYYRSGLFIGLGFYEVEGDLFSGERDDETALGVTIGATGEFDMTQRIILIGEISLHFADLESSQFFGFAHLGVAYRF